jgi:hypothetical protein
MDTKYYFCGIALDFSDCQVVHSLVLASVALVRRESLSVTETQIECMTSCVPSSSPSPNPPGSRAFLALYLTLAVSSKVFRWQHF